MARKKVLVTGAAGRIGQVVREGLKDRYDIRIMFNRSETPVAPHEEVVRGNITDLPFVESAVNGCDAVIHMAGNPSMGASFEEVQAKFLLPYENKIRLNQISPRCFEAAALRTAMVLFEGEYSGVLEPGRHYILLRKDFSNFAEVLDALRDDAGLQRLVDRTFEEIARNPKYSYRTFVEQFDQVVEREFAARGKSAAMMPYGSGGFRAALISS